MYFTFTTIQHVRQYKTTEDTFLYNYGKEHTDCSSQTKCNAIFTLREDQMRNT
jgi:hypothetical protein